MLNVKNIVKSYKTGDFNQIALNDISVKFRNNEFVSILGSSGSGKTTFLNIIGGLDKYDSGDLIINGKSTKKFNDKNWDSYRNNSIGFVFQSYNLIPHINVLGNVEMGMTLSGVSSGVRKKKALEALDRVGLKEHAHKKPNQLSGGQMQRVAIARALVNDPDIILADEPTGALDSVTSLQILDLIKEIAKDKLVIMVTHNGELAKKYSNRIIELKDGKIISDSNEFNGEETSRKYDAKRTAMSFVTAFMLSLNNIITKKGRTILTSFASSIGIIGIALILSLSNGFQEKVDEFERESLSQMPITISTQAFDMSTSMTNIQVPLETEFGEYSNEKYIAPIENVMESMIHINKITDKYVDYIEKIDMNLLGGFSYMKSTSLNIITKNNDKYSYVAGTGVSATSLSSAWAAFPNNPNKDIEGVVEKNYDVLAGKIDTSKAGLILVVDSYNQLDKNILSNLGFDNSKNISFDDILNKEFKVIFNNDYYSDKGNYFVVNNNYKEMYNNKNSMTLKFQAIARNKEGKEMLSTGSGIMYTETLVDKIISVNKDSDVVKKQKSIDYNILSGQAFDDALTRDTILGYLGDDTVPNYILLYPKDFDSKDKITSYLDSYNDSLDDVDKVYYTDMANMISSLSGGIMDAITIVLIAFSSISLIVSSIMIGIITYISVLERTKEIGILRALGARKKDITRVFNSETLIIGICSGLIGIGVALLMIIPINEIIYSLSDLKGVANLNIWHAIILVLISVTLTLIGGLIPAKMASKKDPVIALRTE